MEAPSTLDYVKTIVEGVAASQEATKADLKEWKDEIRQAFRDNREEHIKLFDGIKACENWQSTANGEKAGSRWTTGRLVAVMTAVAAGVSGLWYLLSILAHKW